MALVNFRYKAATFQKCLKKILFSSQSESESCPSHLAMAVPLTTQLLTLPLSKIVPSINILPQIASNVPIFYPPPNPCSNKIEEYIPLKLISYSNIGLDLLPVV